MNDPTCLTCEHDEHGTEECMPRRAKDDIFCRCTGREGSGGVSTNYDKLPEHMQEAARRYIEEGEMPGDFLVAVLENNLTRAFGRADEVNRSAMWQWCLWLHNEIPMGAWGSAANVLAWCNEQQSLRLAARVEQEVPG